MTEVTDITDAETIGKFAEKIKNGGRHVFFLDIDGTMIKSSSQKEVSRRLAHAISEGQKKGHLFFVNSGRGMGNVPASLLKSADFDGVVSSLGAHIVYQKEIIYRSVIPSDLINIIIEYCIKNNEVLMFEGESFVSGNDGRYLFGASEDFGLGLNNVYTDKSAFFSGIFGKNMLKITIPYIPKKEYSEFLENYFDMMYIYGSYVYSEGALIGNNKGTGIRRVCDFLNIPYENTIAIGDSENDIKMLSAAGISAAMGSANSDIKKSCDIVCDTVGNDGAAKLIEALIF